MQSVRSGALRYGLAVGSVGVALSVAIFAHSQSVKNVEIPLLLVAIAGTVWYAGSLPGVLAVILSGLGFDYFFTAPLHTLYIAPADRPVFVVFLLFALVIAFFSARRRRIEAELRRATDELRTLNMDLQARTAELHATNKELEAFAYSISHDLRAPLRHTAGYTELLAKTAASSLDAKGRRYLTLILDAAKRMGNLIDDLLSFSRISRAETRMVSVSLDHLVKEVLSEMRTETEGRAIAWSVRPLPDVWGDRSMLRVVMVNLLSNAVKFTRTRPQAEIEIGCADDRAGETLIFVKDNGVGFDMKYADKLFGVFQRLHPTEAFEGTGIGLATVQRVIHRHGGRVWADGREDGGATFYFSLPHGSAAPRS
jgi:light-regulated signal transduction histidine kinase (bacteriophytochrome)